MLPFDVSELAIFDVVLSVVVLCVFVVVFVAVVGVVGASIALVWYVKFAKICVMVVARTKIAVIRGIKKNISK